MLEINNLHNLEKRIKEELIPKITKQISEEELLVMLNNFFSKESEIKVQMDLSFLNKIDRTGKSNYLKLILEADKMDKLLIIKQNLKSKKQKKEVATSIFSSKNHTNVNTNVDTEEIDEIYADNNYLESPEDMIKMQIQQSNNNEEELEEKMELLMDLIRKGNPKNIEMFLNNNPELKAKYPSIEIKIKKEMEAKNNQKIPKEYKEEENNLYPSPNIGGKISNIR